MSWSVALGYMVIFAGFLLCFVGLMLYNEHTQFPGSDLALIWRDWGVPILLIGVALMGIGVALAWSDIKTR